MCVATNDGTYNNWIIGGFPSNEEKAPVISIAATNFSNGAASYYAVAFGAGSAGSTNEFNAWRIGDFGAGARVTVAAEATSSWSDEHYVAIFGAGYTNGGSFKDWRIGNFGAGVNLRAISDTCAATIFGSGYDGGDFTNWKIGTFGDNSTLTVRGGGNYGHAAIFGAGLLMRNVNFSRWKIAGFGNDVSLTARGSYDTTIFGAGLIGHQADGWFLSDGIDSVDFSHWEIGSFGANAQLSGYNTKGCALFGAGTACTQNTANVNFSGWRIGNFGEGSTLTVSADSGSSAAIFGVGCVFKKACVNFSNWTIGNFGARSELTANYKSATIFGAGVTYTSADFSGWRIGNFGDSVKLCNHGKYSSSRAVFGAGSAGGTSDFSNWSIGSFGANAELIVQRGTSATVFGAGSASSMSNFSNWTIGTFADGAKLINCSTAASFGHVYYALFGPADVGNTHTFTNWTVEFCGNAILGLLVNIDDGRDPEWISLNALGGIGNSDFRFYFNNAKTEDVIVTIGALKSQMPEDGRLAKKEEE
ncbi:MAG: hypothetical protein LBD72_00755, partial [Puniceicoccales bacterium]|nr:hypothetical protein [Puniceicoccales bacterium]